MSLLQCMQYKDYKKALAFSTEQCEKLARLAGLRTQFIDVKTPGELLMRELDKSGCDVQRYNQLASTLYAKAIHTYYRPKAKVAILVANDKYIHLSKLATPSVDCDSIGSKLRDAGFIVIMIKNTSSCILKEILKRVCDFIPEDSYAFIFYAGHGCQIGNIKCLLGVDCPTENIQFEHCISENHVMKELERCKLDLCVLIMDMCRVSLDRTMNPQIYESMSYIEEFNIHKNLLVSYSCQSAAAAYEVLQIECSTTIDCDVTYELKTGDTNRIVPGASQYVNALCTRLTDDLDISSMLDKVHADIEHSIKKQRAVKVQCGVDKRSLYDPVTDNTEELASKLREVSNDFSDCCSVLKK